jgi:phosphoglycerol transferase MdoB-like AlkP superfamily enzyme
LAAAYVLIGAVLRIALWHAYGTHADIAASALPLILAAGLLNDLASASLLLCPLAVALLLLWPALPEARKTRRLVLAFSAFALFAFVYLAFTEFYFFEEFDARFNIVAFDYLMYPTEVAGDLWAEYPIIKVLLFALGAAMGTTWLLRRQLAPRNSPASLGVRFAGAACVIAAAAMIATLWSTDTLSGSRNRVRNEIMQNGVSSFARAARTSEINYDDFYAVSPAAQNVAILEKQLGSDGGRLVAPGTGSLERSYPARPGLGRKNVVLVSSESFGAEFSHRHGSTRDLMPNFDRLAGKGLWFSQAYASGTRTVRGLEALTASFPPIPTVSILRRPGNEGVATWGGVMQQLGYETSFLYGGYGYFDNMNHFYGSNGFDVLDRNDIDNVRFENIWGVSDEDLFDRALEHYDERSRTGKPFFSIVMTTSNHKPFTFRRGLEEMGIPPKGGGREAGVRYADYALGYFIAQAERHPWFKDTVFVIVADHGARVYGKTEIPLSTYEIPLLIYSPGNIAPGQVDTLTTQIDVAPTVLGLLGLPYRAPFFGEDVLAPGAASRVAVFNHNHDVAIYQDGRMAVFGLNREVGYYRYDRAHDTYARMPPDKALRDLGVAYFQTAAEQFRDGRYRLGSAIDPVAAGALTRGH